MRRRLLILFLSVILTIGGVVYLSVLPELLPLSATLSVYADAAIISRENGVDSTVGAGEAASVGLDEFIDVRGTASLALAQATLELEPGTRLILRRHNWYPLGGWFLDLDLYAGHLLVRADSAAGPLHFTLRGRSGISMVSERLAEFVVRINEDSAMQVGVLAGTVTIHSAEESTRLAAGQGMTLLPGQTLASPEDWSRVRVMLYQPDGAAIVQPVRLLSGTDEYVFPSSWMYSVPPGQYTLQVDLIEPYIVANLDLGVGSVHELPVTLSEVAFTLIDGDGTPINGVPLLIRGSMQTLEVRSAAQQGILISPGTWTLIAARADAAQALQRVDVALRPGQRAVVPLQARMFGGTALRVTLTPPPGTAPPDPVAVRVYLPGGEDGAPVLEFRSDAVPPGLPEGDYIVSVLTPVAARFEVHISQRQPSQRVDVPLGVLQVRYYDAQGRAAVQEMLIAHADQMNRLGLPINRMSGTPAGAPYVLRLTSEQHVVLPAGVYNLQTADSQDTAQHQVEVRAGELTLFELRAAQ